MVSCLDKLEAPVTSSKIMTYILILGVLNGYSIYIDRMN